MTVMTGDFFLGSALSRVSNIHTSRSTTRQEPQCGCSVIPVALAVEISNHRTVNRVAARPPESPPAEPTAEPFAGPPACPVRGSPSTKVLKRSAPVKQAGCLVVGQYEHH